VFDSTNYSQARTVFVAAAPDTLAEGERVGDDQPLGKDADIVGAGECNGGRPRRSPPSTRSRVRNVEVTVLDNDAPES